MTTPPYPPIWAVNLPRSKERREYITGHLQALGLPFEIVPAVDGRELPAQELAEIYSVERTVACIKREMALGEVGCALSHLRLYQRMVDEDIAEALIVEDDAVIDPALPGLLAGRQGWPADWELVLLYHGKGQISWWHAQAISPKYRIGRFARPGWGTVGYLIKQSAARKILALAYPVHAPSDHWTCGRTEVDIRLYGIEPRCVTHRHDEVAALYTTIPDKDLYRQLAGFGGSLTGLTLWLHRLKVWAIDVYHKYHPHKII